LAEDGRLSAIDLGDDPGLRTDARVVFSRLGQDAVVFSPLFQAVGLVANGVGWLPTVDGVERPPESPTDETQVFTTIGQHPSVEVEVPG